VKWCNPFGDALGGGYQILTNQEISVSYENDETNFVWFTGGDEVVSTHGKQQIAPELIPEGFDEQPFKFKNIFEIRTPKGYSTLFVHPLNRPELPFHTLSGMVETDTYTQPVNFPFVIRKGFTGIIPKSTPIVSIIPFRRENWKMEIGKYDLERGAKLNSEFGSIMHRAYKTMFWQRKEWK
jgi:hypothetical protein